MSKTLLTGFACIPVALALASAPARAAPATVTVQNAVRAPTGHKFCPTGAPFAVFQKKLDDAIAKDRSGMTALAGCRGRPVDYLTYYQTRTKAGAHLKDVSELPAFVARFKPMPVKDDEEFVTSCLRDKAGGGYVVDPDCDTRSLAKGELAWGIGSEGMYLEDCANPGFTLVNITVRPDCVTVEFPMNPDPTHMSDLRVFPIVAEPLNEACNKLDRPGFATVKGRFFPNDLLNSYQINRGGKVFNVSCDPEEIVAEVQRRYRNNAMRIQNGSWCAKAKANGTGKVRYSAKVMNGSIAFCWELPDGRYHTIEINRARFVERSPGFFVATITPQEVLAAVWNGQAAIN